jgi:hypothetical protein
MAEDAEGEGPNIDASVFLRDLLLPAYGDTNLKHGDQSIAVRNAGASHAAKASAHRRKYSNCNAVAENAPLSMDIRDSLRFMLDIHEHS